ncbi:MAG TPA: helix-turn-helix domain-containing protein [Reyranella sp.]|nr:helix-turn-helix domain-containing protein [Reyranella sp.]HTE82409.1 helix-turn-helix domain-containing protein [Reyranella sp.]
MTKPLNRLRAIRNLRGRTLVDVAAELGISHVQLSRLELEKRPLMVKDLPMLGKALRVPPETILVMPADVRVVGTIGEGGRITENRKSIESVKGPRGADITITAALRIAGNFLEPTLPDGWVAFYEPKSECAPDQQIGALCIVRIRGGTWLKQIRRGYTPGRFNLASAFSPMVEDAEIEWCAPVLSFCSSAVADDDDSI